MKNKVLNNTHIEGLLYDHKLELKKSGETSKNPGTEYIAGTVSIATDDACMNVVDVHFTYVTAVTSQGKPNDTYKTLKSIVDGAASVMSAGKEMAVKVKVDSAIGLNEFFSDRTGTMELVSARRNEGGFMHIMNEELNEDEKARATWEADMLITKVRDVEANPEKNIPHKVIVGGYIFDFRKALLPIEFSVLSENGMKWFLKLDVNANKPYFTKIWGRQVSQTIVKTIEEESAFDGPTVKTTKSSYKDFIVTSVAKEPYIFGDESFITKEEYTKALADRELAVANIKTRQEEYNKTKKAAASAFTADTSKGYDF